MKINERRVRELAYQIWESEGRPEGQHDRHWRMARSLAEAEAANPHAAEEPVQPRFEGDEEPEKPAILQEPPRRKGRLPKADPEVPAASETVAPVPKRAARKPAAKPQGGAAKGKPTKSAPPPTPTAKAKAAAGEKAAAKRSKPKNEQPV